MSYNIPKPPPPTGGTLPFVGPYGQAQAAAELAYQRAQASLAAQRGSLLQSYGYTPNANGGMSVDVNNPYGQYQQMLSQNQMEAQAGQQGMMNRGFRGPGFAGQAEYAAQQDAGSRSSALALNFGAKEEALQEAGLSAQDALNNATVANQYNATQYAIKNNIYTPAATMLTNPEVQRRVAAMLAAWSHTYGGPNSRNGSKMTFQQRLNQLGAKAIYNPTSHFYVGGKRF